VSKGRLLWLAFSVVVASAVGYLITGLLEPPMPVGSVSVLVRNLTPNGAEGAVQTLVTNRSTGRTTDGPILATFQWDSGSHPEWVSAPQALWIFELETSDGPTVWRVSDTTGVVLQTIKVPALVRPLLVADATGLYLAGTGSFGGVGHGLVFHVEVGESNPVTILNTGTTNADLELVNSIELQGSTVVGTSASDR
jgi:hypothetical protein